jgi:hypothetical protein
LKNANVKNSPLNQLLEDPYAAVIVSSQDLPKTDVLNYFDVVFLSIHQEQSEPSFETFSNWCLEISDWLPQIMDEMKEKTNPFVFVGYDRSQYLDLKSSYNTFLCSSDFCHMDANKKETFVRQITIEELEDILETKLCNCKIEDEPCKDEHEWELLHKQ